MHPHKGCASTLVEMLLEHKYFGPRIVCGMADKDMQSAHQWLKAACTELDLDFEMLRPVIKPLLNMTRDIAHGPSRPSAPLTAFLVGLAAGRDTEVSAEQAETVAGDAEAKVGQIVALVERFMADNPTGTEDK